MIKDQSRVRWTLASALVMLFLAALPGSAWAITVNAAVLQGDTAPSTGNGTFSAFSAVSTNASGAIGFAADVSGGTSSQGVFEWSKGVTSAATVQGATAPGTGGGTFASFGTPSLNKGGAIAFVADVSSGRVSQGVFVANKGVISAVAVQGSPAPGGGQFSAFHDPSMNASGDIAFVADLSGGTATQGVFLARTGSISAVALQGSLAPGGETFDLFGAPSLNRAGAVAFVAALTGGSAAQGMFLTSKGVTSVVALQGDAAPGTGTGTYTGFGRPSLNDGGKIAFGANVSGGTATQGVFVASSGGVSAVALQGSGAPGGGTFAAFSSPSLNKSGAVAFAADVSGGAAAQGVFLVSKGVISVVALVGDTAPGTSGGTFSGFDVPPLNLGGPALSDGGVVAFLADVSGGTATRGIFTAG